MGQTFPQTATAYKKTLGNVSLYQDTSKTDLVASIWNHTLEIMNAAKEEPTPGPLIGKRELADFVEFILAPSGQGKERFPR